MLIVVGMCRYCSSCSSAAAVWKEIILPPVHVHAHTQTYQQVFKDLPSHIGFNIEVKYPVPETTDPQYNFSYFERNQMADIILKVVYRYAHKRKIIFSCFDPDMCTM